MEQSFLQRIFLGNTIQDYLVAGAILVSGILLRRILSLIAGWIFYRLLKKHSGGMGFEKFIGLLSSPFHVFIILLAAYIALDHLRFPPEWNLAPREIFGVRMVLFRMFQAALVFSLTWVLMRLTDFFALAMIKKHIGSGKTEKLIPFFKEGAKVFLIMVSLLAVLGHVFEINVVSLVAGVGIGGLAIALAARETLENLLASFTIFLDQPFVTGDQVRVGNITGHVEQIGFRSTRIRTPEKSSVTVPNKKMVEAETENLSKRTKRKAEFTLRLRQNTTHEQLNTILAGIQRTLDTHPLISTEDKVVRFAGFGNQAFEVSVHFYVRTTDGDTFLKVKEEINFSIMDIVRNNNSDFALIPLHP